MKISKNDENKIIVDVKVKTRKLATDPYESISLGDVIQFLESKNIDVLNNYVCDQELTIGNHADNLPLSGQFIFFKKKTLTSAPKTDTVEEVQEEVKPEPKTVSTKSATTGRRRRRTRATRPKEENKLLGTETVE